ncbi:hypothetical protein CkaCkLH20_03588 [Colletotrichum karsti]|uniref:Protein kinase domain-containing protein n=1 Tax=Colletotrichum karsti TaxID=1095194 RepID=A0A9P6I990_9PEZI|nr:uncharacterized protein CkaCkLH20_03588 [Colletotrichum karsti]KAF9878688.1 hypothetical protein CkaCkLH20_03588 [Colletotrichum karsti]
MRISTLTQNDSNTGLFGTSQHHDGGGVGLKRQLEAAMCPTLPLGADDDESREFLPDGELHRLVNPDSALRTLRECMPGTPAWVPSVYAYSIFSGSPKLIKVFAILVLIGKPGAIVGFMRNSISDNDLPLEPTRASSAEETTVRHSKKTRLCCDLALAGLGRDDVVAFEETQWKVLVPSLEELGATSAPSQFHPKTILPFVWDEDAEPATHTGGHSHVYQVQVHPGYHTFGSPTDRATQFALKKLRDHSGAAFEREVSALRRSGDTEDPHIVKLVTAFKHGTTSYLLFPWADTDLQSFWSQTDAPKDEHAVLTVKQMLGVAQTLKAIHYCRVKKRTEAKDEAVVKGYHGDLKPENILVKDGEWKIADFGISRFRNAADTEEDKPLGCSPTYRAPEHDIGPFNGQKADIWSLGCVMSVAATWMKLGKKGVQKFRKERATPDKESSRDAKGKADDSFFEAGTEEKGGLKLKPSVSHWIDKLHQSPTASPLIHDLLDLVKNDMLEVDGTKRITSDQLVTKLQTIHQKCSDDPLYAKPDTRSVAEKSAAEMDRYIEDSRSISVNTLQLPGQYSFTAPAGTTSPQQGVNNFGLEGETCSLPGWADPWPEHAFSEPLPSYQQATSAQPQGAGSGFNAYFQAANTVPMSTHVPAAYPPLPSNNGPSPVASGSQPRKKRHKPNPLTTPSPASQREASEVRESSNPMDSCEQESTVLFACPYFKHNPKKYSAKEWTSCNGSGFKIPRLKEHIRRKHLKKAYRCSRCRQWYDTMADLTEHQKSSIPCLVSHDKSDDRIDEAQWSSLQDRKRGKLFVSKWEDMFQVIFPSVDVPSPYRDEPTEDLFSQFRSSLEAQLQGQIDYRRRLKIQGALELASDFEKSRSVSQSTTDSDVPSLSGDNYSNSTTMLSESPMTTIEASPMNAPVNEPPDLGMGESSVPSCLPMMQQQMMSFRDFTLIPYGSAGSVLGNFDVDWSEQPLMGQAGVVADSQMGMFPADSPENLFPPP